MNPSFARKSYSFVQNSDIKDELWQVVAFYRSLQGSNLHFIGVWNTKNCILSEFTRLKFAFYRSLRYLCIKN